MCRMKEVSEIDLEDLLNGRLSVWCDTHMEVLSFCEFLRSHGVEVMDLMASQISIRVDISSGKLRGAHSLLGPSWQARVGFVERWMYFADFMASCGLSEPQISITTLDDFV